MKLFGKTKEIEKNTNLFLTALVDAIKIFEVGINNYLNGDLEGFQNQLQEVIQKENDADLFYRDINFSLYTKMLIPESRADILSLLENSDDVIDTVKEILTYIDIEQPDVPSEIHEDLILLTKKSRKAVRHLKDAIDCYFNNDTTIQHHIKKVHHYEYEADKIEDDTKKLIFQSDIVSGLAEKSQLRDLITKISLLADKAEDVSDMLSIFWIKRSI